RHDIDHSMPRMYFYSTVFEAVQKEPGHHLAGPVTACMENPRYTVCSLEPIYQFILSIAVKNHAIIQVTLYEPMAFFNHLPDDFPVPHTGPGFVCIRHMAFTMIIFIE